MRTVDVGVVVSLCALAAGGCVPPQGPTSMVSSKGQQTPLRPTGVRVVAAADAAAAGWVARPVARGFGAGRDGTELVAALIGEAEQQRAAAIGEITITLAVAGAGGPAECRTQILPETVSETRLTPATHRLVSVQRPVSRTVSEPQYRCRLESQSQTRSVTEYEQRCRTVSRPVTRLRTTTSYQYDARTRSSRAVPRTESYTTYESQQECRSEPVQRMRTEQVMRNVCRTEMVTQTVTRYEYQLESRYVPPRLETLTQHRLREGAPDCYAIDRPAGAGTDAGAAPESANRIEAVFYFPG